MKNEFEHIDDLIAKVMANEATNEEKVYLEKWASESEYNKAFVSDARKLFSRIDEAIPFIKVDTNAAWSKLDTCVNGEAKVIPLFKQRDFVRIAASVVLLVALGFFIQFFLDSDKVEHQVFTANGSVVETKLPDGSKVFINKNSEVSFSINKNNVREVKLKGEAFFEVVHNEVQPFVISVDDILIKDIGTEFNVKELPGSDVIEVLVEGGEVKFYSENNEGVTLVKGEKARYVKSTKRFEKISTGMFDNTSAYRSKVFNFNNTKLKDAIEQINGIYLCDVRLGDQKMANCPLTVSFDKKDIDFIASTIAETLDMKVEKKDGIIILNGGNCPIP